jgi:branched-chain amino acid transport system substrate-binding protein
MVEAEGASRSLFTQGYKYLFAVLSTSEQYLSTAIHLAADERKKNFKSPSEVRVAMAFEGDPFSMDVRAGVVDIINEYGMEIIIDDQLPADLSDMSTTLTKVKALRPDILVISGHSKGAATAARQIDEMKVNVPMIALTHCEAAKVQEKFPNASTGFLCPTQWVETLSKSDEMFGSAADWNEGFKKEYPSYTSVPYQSAQASAAVYVFKEGFEAANSFDKDAVRDALSAVEMTTFYGDIKFSEAGNNIAKPMFMRQIAADGSYGLVEKFADMSYPRNVTY